MAKITFKVITNTSPLNVRSGPSTDYVVTGSLPKGSTNVAVGTSNGWYKLENGGYCSMKWCSEISREEDPPASTVGDAITTDQSNTKSGDTEQGNTEINGQAIADKITQMLSDKTEALSSGVDLSTRVFGIPHQLTEVNDYRISKTTDLGRMFTESFVINAPLIMLKPGKSNFLPDVDKDERKNIFEGLLQYAVDSVEKSTIVNKLTEASNGDNMRYFSFESDYARYITTVNQLCRIGAVFLGISNIKVPWHKGNMTYGSYNWGYYSPSSIYNNTVFTTSEDPQEVSLFNELAAFVNINVKEQLKEGIHTLHQIASLTVTDNAFVRFYVDANASYNESASNSTSQSALSSFKETLEGMGKELAFVSGLTGVEAVSDLVNGSASSIDSLASTIASGDGQIATFLKRLTGSANQVLAGSNLIIPDIWSDSDYGKNYSFSVSLSTPYGNKESWFLNIYVPLMHILALALPVQTSANTYSAPPLVQAFSPGWFSCDMGIIDSISIDKGGSGDAWASSGLPNELKVSISVRDLYSNLTLPKDYSANSFFNNSSLVNFLMVNCGMDITKPSAADKLELFSKLLVGNIESIISEAIEEKFETFAEAAQKVFNIFQN